MAKRIVEYNSSIRPLETFSVQRNVDETERGDVNSRTKSLDDRGLNIDFRNNQDYTALMVATDSDLPSATLTLADAGADVNVTGRLDNHPTPVMTVAERGHEEFLVMLLRAAGDVAVCRDDQETPLTLAVRGRHSRCENHLLKNGTCVESRLTSKLPLTFPSVNNDHNDMNVLSEYRCSNDIKDIDAYTSSLVAPENQFQRFPELSIGGNGAVGGELNEAFSATNRPLLDCLCAGKGHANTCMNRSSNFINFQNLEGKTALILAADGSSGYACQALLSHGADVNFQDKKGMTALMYSILNNGEDICKLLIHNGASVNRQDSVGKTALMYSAQKHKEDICRLLISSSADVNIQDHEGMTALMYSAQNNATEVCKLLLVNKAVVNIQNNAGKTALMFSAENNARDICKLLTDSMADVNLQDNVGKTALMYSAENDTRDICKLLLDNMADVNITDHKGKAALMYGIFGESFNYILKKNNIRDTQLQAALIQLLENKEKYYIIYRISSLLRYGVNPVLQSIQRSLLTIGPSRGEYSFRCSRDSPKEWTAETLIREPELLRLFVCNGIVPEIPDIKYRTLFQCAILKLCHKAIRYLFANCFVTIDDVQQCYSHAAKPGENLHFARCCLQMLNVKNENRVMNMKLFKEAISQPWPLVKLTFIAVSSALGVGSNRENRVKQTGLPPRIQRMLMFQEPVSLLPVSEWSNIPLCFNPVAYERLPKPRPLLYYWPIGRDIVM